MHQYLVGLLEGVQDGDPHIGHLEQLVIGDDDQGVDLVGQVRDARVRLIGSAASLEGERPGHHPYGQCTQRTGDLGHHRGPTGTGATALAGGDENHVGALQRVLDLVGVILGRLAALLGISTGTQTAGQVPADVELDIGVAHQQRLGIGIDRDELNTLEARLDHPVDGIDTTATDADHLDDCQVILRCSGHQSAPFPASAQSTDSSVRSFGSSAPRFRSFRPRGCTHSALPIEAIPPSERPNPRPVRRQMAF